MKVLQRSITPEGVGIQIEDWSMNYSFHAPADTVATYPKAKQPIPGNKFHYPAPGGTFRLAFRFKTTAEARKCFEQLESGEKTIHDFIANLDEPKYAPCI